MLNGGLIIEQLCLCGLCLCCDGFAVVDAVDVPRVRCGESSGYVFGVCLFFFRRKEVSQLRHAWRVLRGMLVSDPPRLVCKTRKMSFGV